MEMKIFDAEYIDGVYSGILTIIKNKLEYYMFSYDVEMDSFIGLGCVSEPVFDSNFVIHDLSKDLIEDYYKIKMFILEEARRSKYN